MIVKNEEDCIARCLNSVMDVVDEIIIVDTGSTDKTIEICQSFQATIERYEWNGSFAEARNYSLEKATGDWIIWLDADEELDETDRHKLHEGTHFNVYDVITLHLINYYGDQIDKNKTTDVAHTRLFRNNGIKFINKMHERLDLANVPNERIGHLNVKLHHYGYLNPVIENKGKSERNMKMLEGQIKDGENAYWAHYYIALEHYNKKQFEKALERVNLSILTFLSKKVLPPSMVYKLKYSILVARGSFEEALSGIEKAIALYPDYVDLQFFKGMILYYLDEYEAAIKSFTMCMEMGEDNLKHLTLKGVGSFQAWYYLSLCRQKLKQNEESVISIMNALLDAPRYKEAIDTLKLFLLDKDVPVLQYMEKNFQGETLKSLEKIIQEIWV